MSIEDLTGQPVSRREVQEAIEVVQKWMVLGMMKLPPELAVQLPNIRRCLIELLEKKP